MFHHLSYYLLHINFNFKIIIIFIFIPQPNFLLLFYYEVWKVMGHNNLLFYKKINKKYQIFHKYVIVEGSMFKFY